MIKRNKWSDLTEELETVRLLYEIEELKKSVKENQLRIQNQYFNYIKKGKGTMADFCISTGMNFETLKKQIYRSRRREKARPNLET